MPDHVNVNLRPRFSVKANITRMYVEYEYRKSFLPVFDPPYKHMLNLEALGPRLYYGLSKWCERGPETSVIMA